MDNQLPNEFKGEGKTGRFWLSPYHLMEAKHGLELRNSRAKRGEVAPLKDFEQHAWGCGCCVNVLEYDRTPCEDYQHRVRGKRMGRRYSFVEIGGKEYHADATGKFNFPTK